MAKYEIVPGRGKVRVDNDSFFGGNVYSSGNSVRSEKPMSLYERTKAQVYATGNRWAIENFHATHD